MSEGLAIADDVARRRARFRAALARTLAQSADRGSAWSLLRAAAAACREELSARWAATQVQDQAPEAPRRVHYMSMEFLMGRALRNTLSALELDEEMLAALAGGEPALADVLECEAEPGLGNGGLGRLAACFLDSIATLGLPSFGYGIRYEYGMFAQSISDGRQVEHPDHWLRLTATPGSYRDPSCAIAVALRWPCGQATAPARRWRPADEVVAKAYDIIVPGHGTQRVCDAAAVERRAPTSASTSPPSTTATSICAAGAQNACENDLNWVLYPDDSTQAGRELRLRQEYFFWSAHRCRT